MNKRKDFIKWILSGAVIIFSVTEAGAIDNIVKLGGQLDFQSYFYKNNGDRNQRVVTPNNENFGFFSSGNMFLDYRLETDNNIKYGAKIGLELTHANDREVPFSLYTETDLGKLEAGSDKSAGQKMKITGYSSSCAIGNGWNTKVKSAPSHGMLGYVTSFCNFLDTKMRTRYKVEYSRKISYYTPEIHLNESNIINLGISYIPDSSNMGYDNAETDSKHTPVPASKYSFVIKDGVSYGVSHKLKISDLSSIRTSLVGEKGKPIGFRKSTQQKSNIKFKNLNSYVVGTEIKYDKCAVSGSYGNYNNSLSSPKVDLIGKETYIYAIGGKFNFGKYATSLNYFSSNHKKNKFNASSLGFDYNIAKGIKSYIQGTLYEAKGRYLDQGKLKYDNTKGILLLVGAKVNF